MGLNREKGNPDELRPPAWRADNGGMRALLLLFVFTAPLSAETSLYWALANNDALSVWTLTQTEVPPLVDNGLTPPEWAVARGNAEALSALAWRGVALDQVDDQGRNLLFTAAALGRLDLFDTLVNAGARTDQVDHAGMTLVHAAAASPHPAMLHRVLAEGAALTRSELGVTALMVACLAGRADEATVLMAWGAVPEDRDYLGRSVHDYAVRGGDAATVALIDAATTPWQPGPEVPDQGL